MDQQTTSVGRVVHYVSYGTPNREYTPEHRAAVITRVNANSFSIGLCILNSTGIFFKEEVRPDEENKTFGTWHWSERV